MEPTADLESVRQGTNPMAVQTSDDAGYLPQTIGKIMPSAVPICPSCRAIPLWVRLEVGIRSGRATVRIGSRPIIS